MALIAFDCDGVLADFVGRLCAEMNARGFAYTAEDVLHWNLSHCFEPEALAVANEIIGSPGFCASLDWYQGAANLVRYLRAQGHDVVCATSPHACATWMNERRDWLAPIFPAADVLFVKRKELVRADVLVEDHPGNAAAWLDRNPNGVAVLVDRPWNRPGSREFWPHVRMIRAHELSRVATLVEAA